MPLLDELLVKIAMQEKLSPPELETFRQEAKALDNTINFVKKMNVGAETYIENLRLGSKGIGNSDGTILQPFVAAKAYHATDTPITDGTFTDVTFNTNQYGNTYGFQLDAGGKKIYIKTKAKAFLCSITHAWQASGTGVRRTDFQYFNVNDTLIGTALFGNSILAGFAVEENWFPGTAIADLPDTTEYIKCRVKQSSGGNLNLVFFSIGLHIV